MFPQKRRYHSKKLSYYFPYSYSLESENNVRNLSFEQKKREKKKKKGQKNAIRLKSGLLRSWCVRMWLALHAICTQWIQHGHAQWPNSPQNVQKIDFDSMYKKGEINANNFLSKIVVTGNGETFSFDEILLNFFSSSFGFEIFLLASFVSAFFYLP